MSDPWIMGLGGLVLAALFDWLVVYSANLYRLRTKAERWSAFIVAFAFHGPFGAVAGGLFLTGEVGRWLISAGMQSELAGLAGLWLAGGLAFLSVWIVGLLPIVRRARAHAHDGIRAGHREANEGWAKWLGFGGKGRDQ